MRIILQSKIHQNSGSLKIIPPVAFDAKAIYLTSVSIPYTFYNIRSTNNSLLINGTLVSIEEKNYNSIQLASTLKKKLNEIVGGCVVTFDKQKLKYIITNSGEPFDIDFSTSRRLFGFTNGVKNVISNIESNFIGDINDGIHSLILTSNIATPFSCLFNETFGTQIIARIPIESKKPGEIIHYNDPNNQRPIAINVKALQYFEITVLDDNMNSLNLNGTDFQCELFLDLKNINKVVEDKIRNKEGDDEIVEEPITTQTSSVRDTTREKKLTESLNYT